jgi:hypothetical protein
LFAVSAALVAYDLKPRAEHLAHFSAASNAPAHGEVGSSSILLAGVLPAVGAALAAIKDQAELGRTARRSKEMAQSLRAIRSDVELSLEGSSVTLREAARFVEATSERLVEEVMAWRLLLIDRPLELPH